MEYTLKYEEAIEYIESLSSYGIVPGLENITQLCARMGNPQDSLQFVHIAGTNGKGSTLAFISTILKKARYKVGRYVSPTIFQYNERIQIGERPITKAALCEGVAIIKEICDKMVEEGLSHPTPFEVETALAFWYFQKMGCDIVVLETGMGGKSDATNIVKTVKAAVLTPISMDHMQFLGTNLSQIAGEKAGIIKKGSTVISAQQQQEALTVIKDMVSQQNGTLVIAETEKAVKVRYGIERQRFNYQQYKDLEIRLIGNYQITNAILALEVINALNQAGFTVSETALRNGLRETKWQGRFSVISKRPFFVVDGAHNEGAAKLLAESIEIYFTKRELYI